MYFRFSALVWEVPLSPLCVRWSAPSDAVEDVMMGKAVPRFPEPWLRWERSGEERDIP